MGMLNKAQEVADSTAQDAATPAPAPQKTADPQLRQAVMLLHEILYVSDKASTSVVKQLRPENKIGSIVYLVGLLVSQIGAKLNLNPSVIPGLVPVIVSQLVEMFGRVKKVKFSPEETKKTLEAANQIIAQSLQKVQTGASPDAQTPPTDSAPAVAQEQTAPAPTDEQPEQV